MGGTSSTSLTQAVQNLVTKQNQLVYLGSITSVAEDGQVSVSVQGQTFFAQATSDQPFKAGQKVRLILDDKKKWVLLGTVR